MTNLSARFTLTAAACGLIAGHAPLHAATVTWTGADTTWNQPDADSFDAAYGSGDDVIFGNTGVGAVSVGAGVTPGSVTFNHSTGTYTLTGTAFNAGSNPLVVSGAGTAQFGNMTNGPYTPTWGTTSISGGGTLNYTRGTNIGSSGSTVTLNNGTLRVGADNSTTYNYNNPFSIGTGGGSLVGQWGSNASNFNFSGDFSGSGPLALTTAGSTGASAGGLILSGSNSGYSGNVTINSTTAGSSFYGFGSGMTRFAAATALFSNASVKVRDGGVMGFNFAVTNANLSNVTTGVRGGIGAYASGDLKNVTIGNFVGEGGLLFLDNTDTLNNDRIGNSQAVALDSGRFLIRGRNASGNATNETIGDLSFTGGSRLTLLRTNATNSGVKLTVSGTLATPSAGNSLLLDHGNASAWSSAASDALVIVTGTKPSVTNGMVSPGIQHFVGGTLNSTGDFLTFSGDDLILATASYTNYPGDWSGAAATEIVNVTAATTLTGAGALDIHALRVATSGTQNLGGRTVNLGSGGLIMGQGTIQSGTLNFGTGPGFIGAYSSSSQATISAKVSGSDGLTILGTTQTISFTGTNDFTGGIWINGGVARFQGTTGANGNNVTVNAFGRLVPGSNATDTIGGLSGAGIVSGWVANGGSTTDTLVINPASGTFTFDGLMSNGAGNTRVLAITKSGNGKQIFSSDVVATYTGATTVNAGTLLMHGTHTTAGNYAVNANGTLGGNGSITFANGNSASVLGTLAPGASVGTLTFANGDVDIDGEFEVELSGLLADLLVVTGGNLTLDGTIDIVHLTSPSLNEYKIASASSITNNATVTGQTAWIPELRAGGTELWIVIPEPASLALFGIGSLMIGWRKRK